MRAGDDVMIEWLYKEFLPIFLATEKTTYLEIVLGMIDEPLDCQTFPFHYIKGQSYSIKQAEVALKICIHISHLSSLTQFLNR